MLLKKNMKNSLTSCDKAALKRVFPKNKGCFMSIPTSYQQEIS